MKIDKEQLGLHAPWILLATSLTVALVGWYVVASWQADQWLGGASPAGLVCGIAAGLIIALEMLLWPRKVFRRLRLIPARTWMVAHLWLGLASLPLAIAHSGFQLGGMLPKILMLLFVATILSGVYGLVVQNVLPRILFRFLPAETIYSQIGHVSLQNIADTRAALLATCGPRAVDAQAMESEPIVSKNPSVVVGAVRELGLVRGRTIRTANVVSSTRDQEILWRAFDEITPFLELGAQSKNLFASRAEAMRWFENLRRACTDNSEPAIATMEQFYEQRRQFDVQRRLHHALHGWLPWHIAVSVAVSVLLVVHVITALKYW